MYAYVHVHVVVEGVHVCTFIHFNLFMHMHILKI